MTAFRRPAAPRRCSGGPSPSAAWPPARASSCTPATRSSAAASSLADPTSLECDRAARGHVGTPLRWAFASLECDRAPRGHVGTPLRGRAVPEGTLDELGGGAEAATGGLGERGARPGGADEDALHEEHLAPGP